MSVDVLVSLVERKRGANCALQTERRSDELRAVIVLNTGQFGAVLYPAAVGKPVRSVAVEKWLKGVKKENGEP